MKSTTAKNPAWWTLENPETVDSPALLIYPERVKENIALLLSMVGGLAQNLRPHIKTHKAREPILLMKAAGIQKFKCATIAEAEMLASCGVTDILLAYQPVGPKLDRYLKLVRHYPESVFSCLVDNLDAAGQIAAAAAGKDLTMNVFIDLNVGMDRTGIEPGEAALHLYIDAGRLKGLHVIGLHAYDGHIHDHDPLLRKEVCDKAFEGVAAMKSALLEKGLPAPVIVAGGSPTFPIHAKRGGVECSPGTFVYWDKGYGDLLTDQPFLHAALLLARVISFPGDSTICLDLGHKSVSAENPLGNRVHFLNAPGLKPVSQNEEHLVVEAGAGHSFRIGDLLYGVPFHVCPTIALYERGFTIEDGQITGEWKTIARDRSIGI